LFPTDSSLLFDLFSDCWLHKRFLGDFIKHYNGFRKQRMTCSPTENGWNRSIDILFGTE
jgi:hypothetical protein